MFAHSEQPEADLTNAVWYLGIDFGTTGVSAVLLNYSTGQRYPIYWSNKLQTPQDKFPSGNAQLTTGSSKEGIFRLPAVTYSGPSASQLFVQLPVNPTVVGSLASTLANKQPGILLENFKPYLNISIPYYCSKRHEWEPILQLPSQQLVSLYWVRRALQALLATLTPKNALADADIKIGAVGLKAETLECALQQLEGVILGCPAGWGDTYRFNLREAILEAKLVRYVEQIFFLEDAIASILAGLPTSSANPLQQKSGAMGEAERGSKNSPPLSPWQGSILVINAGATTTELALVDLPDNLQDLTYSDFSLCSLPYGGSAIDQDIFCQLLYPQMSLAQREQLSLNGDLELPLPGQPDKPKRDRLASQLQQSPLGQSLLKAAAYLKLILQRKNTFTLELGTDRWTVKHLDLEASVIAPFIQQLNRQLNALLIETGISEQGIYQVICTGSTTAFSSLKKWVQQKLPNATLLQDADSLTGNWVASGLASLPFYPQVLNRSEQQYSDYFLLLELLRAFPETTNNSAERRYRIEDIMQQLERRGLNTNTCYERLVRLVQGQLPPGLVPSIEDASWLSEASKQNHYYSSFAATPQLFIHEGYQLYCPNSALQEHLRQYLNLVLSGTHQKFEEPLVFRFATRNT